MIKYQFSEYSKHMDYSHYQVRVMTVYYCAGILITMIDVNLKIIQTLKCFEAVDSNKNIMVNKTSVFGEENLICNENILLWKKKNDLRTYSPQVLYASNIVFSSLFDGEMYLYLN